MGVHVNSVHFTTVSECCCGWTPWRHSRGLQWTHLWYRWQRGESSCLFSDCNPKNVEIKLVQNISNSLTDHWAVNHPTTELVSQAWDKLLNELNCHLHSLDSLVTKAKRTLKDYEKNTGLKNNIFGTDCISGGIVLSMNKLRYHDGKGDPCGFLIFLEQNMLSRGILPISRGNRWHVLFHICGTLMHHYVLFVDLLAKAGLCNAILADFKTKVWRIEMHVLDLLWKPVTGLGRTLFLMPAVDQIDHSEGISWVKDASQRLKDMKERPNHVLSCSTEVFGSMLDESNVTLTKLQEPPVGEMSQRYWDWGIEMSQSIHWGIGETIQEILWRGPIWKIQDWDQIYSKP